MINVVYDRDIYLVQPQGGIARYFTCLKRQLSLLAPDLTIRDNHSNLVRSSSKMRNALNLALNFTHTYTDTLFSRTPCIYHPTSIRNLAASMYQANLIITVHDFVHELHPEYFENSYQPRISWYITAKRRLILSAKKIIAVSQSTKSDLLRIYPFVPEDKVHVVHHGCDHLCTSYPDISSSCSTQLDNSTRRLFLFIGTRHHYKGFKTLVLGLSGLKMSKDDWELICIGSPLTDDEKQYIASFGLQGNIKSDNASDSELARYYSIATCVVYPSFYEGFGFPILEALSHRCPIICSDIPSSREVGADLATYFPPGDHHALSFKLDHCDDLKPLLLNKESEILRHLSYFTWSRVAKQTSHIYRAAI